MYRAKSIWGWIVAHMPRYDIETNRLRVDDKSPAVRDSDAEVENAVKTLVPLARSPVELK